MKHSKENRRHERLFFSPADKVEALLVFLNQEPIEAAALDLSESGIGLTAEREKAGIIRAGDRIFLAQLNGISDLQLDAAVEIEVKWVLDHEFLGRIALGCEFQDMPESIKERIRERVMRDA